MNTKVWGRVFLTLLLAGASGLMLMGWAGAQGQSPIDILVEDVDVQVLSSLRFHYNSHVRLDVFNNGVTIRADVPVGTGRLRIAGTNYEFLPYELLQSHFHTPSEHRIQGLDFPMEMHLVHQAADGTLLVVGGWIVLGDRHEELDRIFARLPQEEGVVRTIPRFDLETLLPKSLRSFRYTGSLTTEPFTEGVQWIVLAEPIEMSLDQILAFVKLFPEGNAREIQQLNGRRVLTDLFRECNKRKLPRQTDS